MYNQTTMYLLIIFVALSAIALVVQLVVLMLIYSTAMSIRNSMSDLTGRFSVLGRKAKETTVEAQKNGREILQKAKAIGDQVREEARTVKRFTGELSERGTAQMDRARILYEDTRSQLQESVASVRQPWTAWKRMRDESESEHAVSGNGSHRLQ